MNHSSQAQGNYMTSITTWYHVVARDKNTGLLLILATAKKKERAEDVISSMREYFPEKVWDIQVEREDVESER
jgi:hypothetical protein